MWLTELKKGRGVLNAASGIICFVAALSYLLNVFIPSPVLFYTFSTLSGILLIVAMLTARLGNKLAALTMLLTGLMIFILERPGIDALFEGFARNMNLIALFVMVPLIGVLISTGGYLTAMRTVLQNQKERRLSPYSLAQLLTMSMGIFLNLGTMPIVHRIIVDSTAGYEQKMLGLVLQRAFIFCLFWSPYFVNVGLILTLFDITWMQVAWVGILFGIFYLLCSLYFNRKQTFSEDHRVEEIQSRVKEDVSEEKKKLGGLVRWLIGLLLISLLLDSVTSYAMLTIVAMIALVYPFVWAYATRVLPDYIQQVRMYILNVFYRLQNELLIFLSAGFFGASISHTQLGKWVSESILLLSHGSVLLFSCLVMLLTIGLAVVGIHPVIIVIGIGASLSPDVFGVSATYMAVLLLNSWALGTTVSPLSGSVLMTSNLSKEKATVIAKKNAPLTLLMVLLTLIFLYAFHVLNWI